MILNIVELGNCTYFLNTNVLTPALEVKIKLVENPHKVNTAIRVQVRLFISLGTLIVARHSLSEMYI